MVIPSPLVFLLHIIDVFLGSDMRALLSRVVFHIHWANKSSPCLYSIHWAKATNFSESATHAIDFGPGGVSGIVALTARISMGEGKGDAELYSSVEVKCGERWSKRWSPNLMRTR